MSLQTPPRWFRALFVAVMLFLCIVVAFETFHMADLRQQIVQLTDEVSISRQRLRKQQMEYDAALAELPLVQAELSAVAPQAEAIYAREQELRALRKQLRAENKELQAQVEDLQALSAGALPPETQSAIDLMLEALTDLQSASDALGQPLSVPDAP